MAAWCLPKPFASAFMNALKDGKIVPEKLMDMTSEERRVFFEDIVGREHAPEVNALFESKLLLKDQQRGLVTWARQVAGLSERARTDIIDRINKMDRVLNPQEEKDFLADLAAQKLGVSVTASEAKEIFDLAGKASQAEAAMTAEREANGYRPLSIGQALKTGTEDKGIAYGRAVGDLTDKIESLKPNGRTWTDFAIDLVNLPKSVLTSVLHFSAPFVQGWGMLSTARAWQGFGQMFRYFASEENYANLNAYIISHPDFPLVKAGKLGLTKLGDKLSAREEAIQSSLVEQANQYLSDKTGVPNLVRASSRAFTGYLNFVRFSRYVDLLNAARLAGEDVSANSDVVRDLAKVVNDFTGRGEIAFDVSGKAEPTVGERSVPALNAMFFSPRKLAATMHMFNPVRYLNPNISATARKAAFRQLTGSLIATGAVLSIAKATGAQVSFDPRDANFAKIKLGKTTLDMTGGNAIYLRLLARLATNEEVTARGRLVLLGTGYKPTTRADLIASFLRAKLAPVPGLLADALYGSDPAGRPFSITDEMKEKMTPIFAKSFYDFVIHDPDSAANPAEFAAALTSMFGIEMHTQLPRVTRTHRDIWGNPAYGH